MKLLPKRLVDIPWLGCFSEHVLSHGMPVAFLPNLFLALCEDDLWYEQKKSTLPADQIVLGPEVTSWCQSVLGSCDPHQAGANNWQIEPAAAKQVLMRGLKTYYEGAEHAFRKQGIEVDRQQEKSKNWLIDELSPRNTNWRMQ